MKYSCEYAGKAVKDSRKLVKLQLGGQVREQQILAPQSQHATNVRRTLRLRGILENILSKNVRQTRVGKIKRVQNIYRCWNRVSMAMKLCWLQKTPGFFLIILATIGLSKRNSFDGRKELLRCMLFRYLIKKDKTNKIETYIYIHDKYIRKSLNT